MPRAGPSPGRPGAGGRGPLRRSQGLLGMVVCSRLACPLPAGLGWEGRLTQLSWARCGLTPAYFLRLLMALRPWGAARQSEGLRRNPHPLIRAFLRPRNRWNSQKIWKSLQKPWGEGCGPPLPSSGTPHPSGRPLAAVSLERGGFSLSHFPGHAGCGLKGHSGLGLGGWRPPEVSHTPCQDPPRASPSSHTRPLTEGPGARQVGMGVRQGLDGGERGLSAPLASPGGGQAGMGWQPRLLGSSWGPTLVQSPRPRARPQAHGLCPVHPRCRGSQSCLDTFIL